MIKHIKHELLNNPNAIVNILLHYDFYKPKIAHKEIRFGYEFGSNPTSICIKLQSNDNLFVKDYARDLCYDLFTYIIKTRQEDFKSILTVVKTELGVDDFDYFDSGRLAFGGFYNRIKHQETNLIPKVYKEEVLNDYVQAYNLRFGKDHINMITQEAFQIGYDVVSQRITIPIRNIYGELIGVKGRANWEVDEDEPKYLYLIPCPMSTTLFGYCQNYIYLNDQKTILIGESEKFVMQCYSYGIRNCVSIGSNALSNTQCKLLMELSPKEIVFMLDKSLDTEITRANAERLKVFSRMFDMKIMWWDWTKNQTLPDKASPSDYGKEELMNILQNEICEVEIDD